MEAVRRTQAHTDVHEDQDSAFDDSDEFSPKSLMSQMRSLLQRDVHSQRLLLLSLVMALFALLSLLAALRSQSLALLAAAFHGAFTACALLVALASLALMRHRASKTFSYGVERAEVLGVFGLSSLSLFVALFVLKEAAEQLLEGLPPTSAAPLVHVALLGLALHSICAALFARELALRADLDVPTAPIVTQHGALVASALLLCDAALVSTWPIIDALSAIIMAGLMLAKALPALAASSRVLLQSVPRSVAALIDQSLSQMKSEGLISDLKSQHSWTFAPGVYVASLALVIPNTVRDEAFVIARAQELMGPYVRHLTVQIERT